MIKPMYHYVSAAIDSEHGWGWWSCQIKLKFKLSCLLHEDKDVLRNSDNAFSKKERQLQPPLWATGRRTV
jgi:hypothetical protein